MSATDVDDALVVRYLDGAASDEEVAVLEQRLLRDVPARRSFVAFAHLHALLVDAAVDPGVALAKRRQRTWRAVAATLAAAALVAVWLARVSAATQPAMPTVSALSGTIAGERDDRSFDVARDDRLHAGDRVRVSAAGAVELAWANGDRVAVAADTALTIAPVPAETLHLDQGRLVITVAAHDAGARFAIATDEAVVTDIGTVFAVERAPGATTVDVVSGTVRVAASGGSIEIPAGHSGVAMAGQVPHLIDASTAGPPPQRSAPATAAVAASPPVTAVEWAEPLPAPAVDGPSVDLVDWRVASTTTVALAVDAGTPLARVVDRDQPQRELGRAPVPDLRYFERGDLDAIDTVQLIDDATGRMWELARPEPGLGGDVVASALRAGAADTPRAPRALGGLLGLRDLEHPSRHALAISLPRSPAGSAPSIGQRLRLASHPPLGGTARADVAAAALVACLTTHGAWVVGTDDHPTLHVDPLVPEDLRAALARTLAGLAGSWRLAPARDRTPNAGNTF